MITKKSNHLTYHPSAQTIGDAIRAIQENNVLSEKAKKRGIKPLKRILARLNNESR